MLFFSLPVHLGLLMLSEVTTLSRRMNFVFLTSKLNHATGNYTWLCLVVYLVDVSGVCVWKGLRSLSLGSLSLWQRSAKVRQNSLLLSGAKVSMKFVSKLLRESSLELTKKYVRTNTVLKRKISPTKGNHCQEILFGF